MNNTSISPAQASWELKIGNLCQKALSPALWASAACSSGPTTPPVDINGSLEKLRALARDVTLTSPIMVPA